ncbi:MAG: alpha-amylase [Flavobacteriaceae bacterium]|nr:alpha-amylase [Flavobacteriaceae bacterium]
MKIHILWLLLVISFISCKNDKPKDTVQETEITQSIAPITDTVLESAVIYEANIRQYSPQGTFNAFTKDIPQLRELGVKIIWLMPVFPISEVKRKASGDLMIEDIEDPKEREKILGSYYAVSDFRKINPDLGTREDFRKLMETAHDHGMYVILDWVPNHTGWDHYWITEKPEFYTRNALGEITDPLKEDGNPVGWADVADLNYVNLELRKTMIAQMLQWVKEEDIDGFRCDMAGMVPDDFWEEAIPRLREVKPVFMLAEADKPELSGHGLFEMSYGWEVHHILNAIAQGKKDVSHFDEYIVKTNRNWKDSDILMNFVTNHDENAWAGPVRERMGDGTEALLALTYCMPGMPLIYSGQEYDLDRRLEFFKKDSIPKKKGNMWPLLSKLGTMKNSIPAMSGGKNAASYQRIVTSNSKAVLAFKREKEGSEILYIANLSSTPVKFKMPLQGAYDNALTGEVKEFVSGVEHELDPWQYFIFTK